MFPGQLARTVSPLLGVALAALSLNGCGGIDAGPSPAATEASPNPPVLASLDSARDPALILDADTHRPASLSGAWDVASGKRSCSLSLVVDGNEVSGETTGCSDLAENRPIAIGLISGSSFLFQTGRGAEGWIWSGRYDSSTGTLEGRREHVITGKLESFVARR